MIILDTHALLWLRTGASRLGTGARRIIDDAHRDRELAVSAMTFWEVAMLRDKNRLVFPEDVGLWRRELLGQGLVEIPVDGEIGIRANALPGFTPTPSTASSSPPPSKATRWSRETGQFSNGAATSIGWTRGSDGR